jgi:hypothetical protein
MKFSQMLEYLDGDVKMIRDAWGISGDYYRKDLPTCIIKTSDYFVMFKDGKWYPGWLPSAEDLFAEDWHRLIPKIRCCAQETLFAYCIDEPCIDGIKEKFIQSASDAQYSNDPEWAEEKNKYTKRLRESINTDRHIKSESDINEDDGSFIKHFQD